MKKYSLFFALLVVGSAARVGQCEEQFDFEIWKKIPVLHEGRVKPFDTVAMESITGITDRASMSPTAFWLLRSEEVRNWSELVKRLDEASKTEANPLGSIWRRLPPKLQKSLKETDFDLKATILKRQTMWTTVEAITSKINAMEGRVLARTELASSAKGDLTPEELPVLMEFLALDGKLRDANGVAATLLRDINTLLTRKDFLTNEQLAALTLPETAKSLLAKGVNNLDSQELQLLNRAALSTLLDKSVLAEPQVVSANIGGFKPEAKKYPASEAYIRLLMSWKGWDAQTKFHTNKDSKLSLGTDAMALAQVQQHLSGATGFWQDEKQFDTWDRIPFFNARYESNLPIIMPETEDRVSFATLVNNDFFRFEMAAISYKSKFESDRSVERPELSDSDDKLRSLARATDQWMQIRAGTELCVGPNQTKERQVWFPLFSLIFNDDLVAAEGFDSADIAKVRTNFFAARKALFENKPAEFNAASKEFVDVLLKMGDKSDLAQAAKATVARELHYNKLQPFLTTTYICAAAVLIMLLSLSMPGSRLFSAGVATLVAAMAMMAYGLTLRVMISGRAPVTGLYETLIWSSLCGSVFALVIGSVYKSRIILLTTSVVLMISTIFANIMPPEYGVGINPLMPVLRDNFWLVIHVMTIVASYGAFMLAWGLGNVGLGFVLAGKDKPENIKPITMVTYRAMQVGVLLLASGTLLGGWWAAKSWGRFWGWDSKEVMAMVALIGYLIILHCRIAGLVKNFGTLVGAVVGFMGVLMSWYGANFVFTGGLHAYATGTGGMVYVLSGVALNALFLAIVCTIRSTRRSTLNNGSHSVARATGEETATSPEDETSEAEEAYA